MLQILKMGDKSAQGEIRFCMTNVSIHIELSNMYLKRRTHIFSSTGSKGDDILNTGIGTENKKIIGEALNYAYDLILKSRVGRKII